MTIAVQSGRRNILQSVDAPTACCGHAGLMQPSDDDRPTEIIEIGSLGVASPPIA